MTLSPSLTPSQPLCLMDYCFRGLHCLYHDSLFTFFVSFINGNRLPYFGSATLSVKSFSFYRHIEIMSSWVALVSHVNPPCPSLGTGEGSPFFKHSYILQQRISCHSLTVAHTSPTNFNGPLSMRIYMEI